MSVDRGATLAESFGHAGGSFAQQPGDSEEEDVDVEEVVPYEDLKGPCYEGGPHFESLMEWLNTLDEDEEDDDVAVAKAARIRRKQYDRWKDAFDKDRERRERLANEAKQMAKHY